MTSGVIGGYLVDYIKRVWPVGVYPFRLTAGNHPEDGRKFSCSDPGCHKPGKRLPFDTVRPIEKPANCFKLFNQTRE